MGGHKPPARHSPPPTRRLRCAALRSAAPRLWRAGVLWTRPGSAGPGPLRGWGVAARLRQASSPRPLRGPTVCYAHRTGEKDTAARWACPHVPLRGTSPRTTTTRGDRKLRFDFATSAAAPAASSLRDHSMRASRNRQSLFLGPSPSVAPLRRMPRHGLPLRGRLSDGGFGAGPPRAASRPAQSAYGGHPK